jgi:lipopolysaccharide exporter
MGNNNRYWIKSGFFSVLQNLSGQLLALGTLLILVRHLNKHDWGVWALFSTTVTILEFIRNGLVQNALIKFLAAAEDDEKSKIISSSFVVSGVLTIFCIIINLCFASFLGTIWKTPELEYIFHLYCFSFIISGVLTQFNCILQANLQFRALFISSTIMQAIFFVYVVTCYIMHIELNIVHLVYVQMFNYFIGACIAYIFVKPFFFISFKIHFDWIKKLFNYGKYAFGTYISSILSVTVDQMMLGAILSPTAAGVFSIPVKINTMLDVATNSLAVILFPQSAKRIETEGKQAVKYLYEKSVGTLLAILAPAVLFLFLFSSFVVYIIAGSKYPEAIPILNIILLYSLLTPYGRLFGIIMDSMGKTKLTFYVVSFVAALNLGLNYLFISHLGVMGAAYATLLSSIIGAIIGQIILRKELNVSIYNTFVYAYQFYPDFYGKYVKPYLDKRKAGYSDQG